MNRAAFETYCTEHDWTIDCIPGYIRVMKGNSLFHDTFMIGMDLSYLVRKMKREDYGTEEVQGKFPFTNTVIDQL